MVLFVVVVVIADPKSVERIFEVVRKNKFSI